ncbi:hypothetical protein P153DRAFT_366804 [Dothidotthia symphoricarpi CBS 119687]|uniref:Uncharacterized protein n=1 Tax=Dothidotthia symphoricarpi CBS 119687 TaxID=1392245 RepID=A0A6A6ABW6_9PLEO|nr:uncharacterized protein P153DRAFT_366804 [Dothidotthia symphoricarpi CBS 119687]KAF2129412.1 hypothetical protein P153DRAFT_366804 [Dothidotthia symphoricarpi CBS 119687]
MYSKLLANLLLFLSIFRFTLATSEQTYDHSTINLAARQISTNAETCLDYEVTANRSTIGANSTYRSAFLQKSSTGTMYNARMLDAASKKLPALTANKELNDQCGNWTKIAFEGAQVNFTNGIVAQFSTEGLPVGIKAGPELIGIIGGIATLMSVVWVFS